jgi:hypothetical protein
MNQARLRIVLRWVHIVLGLVILCYIYSPFNRFVWFQLLMKFLVLPAITFTGIWVWKFKAFNKFFHVEP